MYVNLNDFQISPIKEKEGEIINQEELCNIAKSWTEQYPDVKESSYPM